MKHLLENWNETKELFSNSLFLMSDFDGTLTPIVDKPKNAYLSPKMRKLLSDLNNYCPIGIISGRSLDDLKDKIRLNNIYYSGNHGFEITGPNLDYVKKEAEEAKKIIDKVCHEIRKETSEIDSLIIENKGYTASIHYRLVDKKEIPRIRKVLEDKTQNFRNRDIIKINQGKKVFEIGPALNWDKGDAVFLLRSISKLGEEPLVIYLGDDLTDENAFTKLKKTETGFGILISEKERKTDAKFRLKNPQEVKIFLKKLLNLFKHY